ncbi:30S ribosomal protein S27ae [Candidatus Woesearchaeota archaeon]|nr:30S ribosomal protein S27ae [Candidatus Woesearchaeota archaeon]
MGKKPHKNPPAVKIHKLYAVKGESFERTAKTCPKCGAGTFMAKHKDRYTCGKCKYTEFSKN